MQLSSKNSEHSSIFPTGELPLGRNGSSNGSKLPPNDLVPSVNGSKLFDSRISYLKILALSLLREIASAENVAQDHGNDSIDLQAEVRRFESELIRSALIQTRGCQRQAARLLRTKVSTLNTKIKRYKIEI